MCGAASRAGPGRTPTPLGTRHGGSPEHEGALAEGIGEGVGRTGPQRLTHGGVDRCAPPVT